MNEKNNEIGIIGAGGQAKEVVEYLREESMSPAFFAVDHQFMDHDNSEMIDILNPNDYQEITPVIAAIGPPELRRRMVNEWRGEVFSKIISEHAYVGNSVTIGEGTIIAPRAVITANAEIGEHVIINVGASISHDCKIGNYATISPGSHIGGGVEIGDGVFIGIGAIISNGLKIANGSVIGAGAVLVSDVLEENSVMVGVPAKKIRNNEGWLNEL